MPSRAPAALLALAAFLPAGCPTALLPDALDVNISADQKLPAAIHSGPPVLEHSTWSVFRKPDPPGTAAPPEPPPGPYGGLLNGGLLARPPTDTRMFRIEFGPGGVVTRVLENLFFLADVYGPSVPVTSQPSPTSIPGVTFRSASYGVQVGERFGIAVVVHVDLWGAYVGRAVLYAWGTVGGGEDGAGLDRIDGTFGYLLDFEGGLGGLLLTTGGDQYPVYAVRD